MFPCTLIYKGSCNKGYLYWDIKVNSTSSQAIPMNSIVLGCCFGAHIVAKNEQTGNNTPNIKYMVEFNDG